MSVLMGYHIKRVELIIRENVRTFFPQGQRKPSVTMRGVHKECMGVRKAGFDCRAFALFKNVIEY